MEWLRHLIFVAVAVAATTALPADPVAPVPPLPAAAAPAQPAAAAPAQPAAAAPAQPAAAAPAQPAAAAPAQPAAVAPVGDISNICDEKNVCICTPNDITCTCKPDMQDLVVKSERIPEANLRALKYLQVKDCNSLTVLKQTFKLASNLEKVDISNVKKVSFGSNVFDKLKLLKIDIVKSMDLEKDSLRGIQGLNNIVITKTQLPLLPEGVFNISDLQEFKLAEVNVTKIEKNAILISLKQLESKAEILQTKIGNIEERGLEIANGSSISVKDTEIQRAVQNSIILGALETLSIKGNTFHPDVNVEAAKIQFKKSIEFSKNILLNVDLSNAANILHMSANKNIFTLDRLVTLHGGNYLNCKCIDSALKASEHLKQNGCDKDCPDATVEAFLKSCKKNTAVISAKERLKTLCKTSPANTQRPGQVSATSLPKLSTTASSKGNLSGKTSVYVHMLVSFFLFHLIL